MSRTKKVKREYLNNIETREILKELNRFFEVKVEVKRIRNGEHQTFETLINEEALLFTKYLRKEKKEWIPRLVK
jgi:ribosomal protein L28